MKIAMLLLASHFGFAIDLPPIPLPIFLRAGFSSVLEFEEAPARVVLGDSQKFQVERLEKSLVIKTLAAYASTNMFVYFKDKQPRIFVLTASEDAQPTYYLHPEPPADIPRPPVFHAIEVPFKKGTASARLMSAKFDTKKDYLTVEILLGASSGQTLHPLWGSARLRFKDAAIAPYKLWAERKEIQKDARVRARFIFSKPNVPRNLVDVSLVVPLQGSFDPIRILLTGGKR